MKESYQKHDWLQLSWDRRAEYYDLFASKQGRKDIDFYVRLASLHGSPVLEGGCGTGRLIIPIATSGLSVTGIDFSELLLDRCRQNVTKHTTADIHDRIALKQADLREPFDIDQSFALAFLAYGTFGCFLDDDQVDAVLQNMRRCLSANGTIVVDRSNRGVARYHSAREFDWAEFVEEQRSVVVQSHSDVVVDESRHIRQTILYYEEIDFEGNSKQHQDIVYLRDMSELELQQALDRNGFRTTRILGDYDGGVFTPLSPRIIVLAEKV